MPRMRRSAALLLLPLLLILSPASDVVRAQEGVGIPLGDPPAPMVKDTDLFCAGFIANSKLPTGFMIVGGEREGEINWFTTTNVVYLNYGQRDGASVGENLYVLRERGKYENPFTGKDVGRYVQELGIVRILSVQRSISIAEVVFSCEGMRIGDAIRPFDRYVVPPPREYVPLSRYDLPSGKLSGQIILSRNFRDYMAERDIVYLDIGDRRGVEVGQYFTVYRRPGIGEGLIGPDNVILRDDDDYESRIRSYGEYRYRNGDFSILKGKRDEDDVLEARKGLPRKVVGELCIIRVEEKSATAVITRVNQEVNVGDYVELQ